MKLVSGALVLLAAVTVLVWWTTKSDAGPGQPLHATGRADPVGADEAALLDRPEVRVDSTLPAPEAELPREAEPQVLPGAPAPPFDPEDPVQCVVYGRVVDPDGEPVGSSHARLTFTDEVARRVTVQPGEDGSYSISGLDPGTHWLRAGCLGYRDASLVLTLTPEQPVVRRDVELTPANIVKVRAVTPDGLPLYDGLRAAGLPRRQIVPVATKEHPGERFYEVTGSLNNPFGDGQYWGSGYIFDRLPPEYLGVLVLDGDGPVHVSIVFHHLVLATERVEAGVEEVEFVLGPDDFAGSFGGLELRLVDAESGAPIAGADSQLEGTSYMTAQRPQTDDRGRLQITDREPGRHTLTLTHPDYERCRQEIELQPGVVLDLGTIELREATEIRGKVLTQDGQPASVDLRILRVDPRTGELHNERRRSKSDAATGAFAFTGLGYAEYVVATYGDDQFWYGGQTETVWVSANVVARTFAGSVVDLVVPVVAPDYVSVRGPAQGWKGLRYAIVDDEGRDLRSRRFYGVEPQLLKLPPGTYRFRTLDADGETLEERVFSTGAEPVTLQSTAVAR